MEYKKLNTAVIAIAGILAVMLILILGTLRLGRSARDDSDRAVRAVSLLYLGELADRREQVVANNLQGRIADMQTALELMTEEDLSDIPHLQAYQAKMKRLFTLEKFAFVDESGLIYTSLGVQTDIGDYHFDHLDLHEAEVSVKNLQEAEKKVIIAMPLDRIPFSGGVLTASFMEIDMNEMLRGISMTSQDAQSTFSNIYTRDGVALTNTVLGGLAVEDNLLDALSGADYESGYSYERVRADFASLTRGETTFTYNGVRETLSYMPVEGTDWLLTYLVRESVISGQISSISDGIIRRSLIQSVATVLVMLAVFAFIVSQNRKNVGLRLAKETADAEVRGKQEELEQRIALQEQLEEQSHALSDALQAAEQASKAKTVFLSNMSHEIRTPLNAIIGLDSIALNDPDISDRTREHLTKIGSSADHLLNLINDILDMSRIESGRMVLKNEEFSFAKLLESVNTMFSGQCQDKGLDYRCDVVGQVDDYYIGDSMKLRQVLINLLGNAVKFTPEGGSVRLSIERRVQYENQTTLRFTVTDTGIGMSREFLPHIFEAFSQEDSSTTSKYGSSGLGLALTKSIVEMMNGSIQVQSKKGVGSTFTVTVTLANYAGPADAGMSGELHPGDMTVLVIDDDPVACEHALLVLEKAGVAAEIAGSGPEGIEMVRLRQARMEPYQLILVDWKMPEMDGVETTRRIRELVGSDSAIIILTAYRWDDVLEEALKAGVDSFLSKPLFAGSVMEEFGASLRKRRLAAGAEQRNAELSGKRVLLAEDVEVNAEIVVMLLEMRGVDTEVAENGRVALEKFSASAPGYYDAVLMDMRMPEMDGLEAARAIRALDREDARTVPIIALTANAFDEDVQRSMQAGLNAHLSKPVQPDTLYETLESLIPG